MALTMWRFIVLILFTIAQCSDAEVDEIVLTFCEDGDGNVKGTSNVPPLTKDQYFVVVVKQCGGDFFFQNITCSFSNNPNSIYLVSSFTKTSKGLKSKTESVTKYMEVKWKCLLSRHNNKAVEIEFDVKFNKPSDTYLNLFVSNNKMNLTANPVKTETDFDSKTEYKYYDGELVKIMCEKSSQANFIKGHLTFYNDTTILKTEFHSSPGSETIYIKLTKEHNASHFDCTMRKTYPSDSYYTARLLFIVEERKYNPASMIFLHMTMEAAKPPKHQVKTKYKIHGINPVKTVFYSDAAIFKINDLMLSPTKNDTYSYDYFINETIDLVAYTGSSNNQWYCLRSAQDEDSTLEAVERQKERLNLTAVLDYTKSTPATIDCFVGRVAARLSLFPFTSTVTFDPIIHGLSLSKTLLAYQENEMTYLMTYYNTKNSSLTLNCVSKHTGCKWDVKKEYVIEKPTLNFVQTINKYSSVMTLQNLNASVTVNCTCPQDSKNKVKHTFSVHIISQPKEETIIDEGVNAETSKAEDNNNFSAPVNDGEGPKLDEIGKLAGIIVGTLLIVILVIWIILGLLRRKKKLEEVQASDINYVNLPEHNEGPMPIPAQWNQYAGSPTDETYTYCVPYVEKNVEQMYAQPQPKSQRQPEMMYAEVGALEPNYAAPGPKESPSLYMNTKENQMPTYSQVQPKSLRGNTGNPPQVLPKPVNQNYAQVLPKSVCKQGAQYENLFKTERYVNTDKGEYAEPAYCEVPKK